LERKFLDFIEILENANMLCHDMQPNALLIWRGFINAKKWVLHWPPLNLYFHPPLHLAPIILTPLTKSFKSKANSFHRFSRVLFIYLLLFFEIFDFILCNDEVKRL
jgi:hypothetical protein